MVGRVALPAIVVVVVIVIHVVLSEAMWTLLLLCLRAVACIPQLTITPDYAMGAQFACCVAVETIMLGVWVAILASLLCVKVGANVTELDA